MTWPTEIQQMYEEKLAEISYSAVNLPTPVKEESIISQVYAKNEELNNLRRNPSGKKATYIAKLAAVEAELTALAKADTEISMRNQTAMENYNAAFAREGEANKHNSNFQWSAARFVRNLLLTECDWTQLPDAPITSEKAQEWREYRKALRDIPDLYSDVGAVEWPAKPV